MQNILCALSRERAKFVPILSVAGRAGGTTIVIKSSALTMIRCHESYKLLVAENLPGSKLCLLQGG